MGLPKIELPLSRVKLPSGKSIQIRPFTVKEEKLLLLINQDNNSVKDINDIIRQVINNCTEGKVDSYKLPMFDMEYLFTELRKISVGETIDYIYTCPSCSMKFETSVDLNNIKVENIKKSTDIKLDDEISFKMRYPSQQDENKTAGMGVEERVMEYANDCIEKIFVGEESHDTKDLSKEEVQEFIDSLPGKAISKLIEFFLDLPMCKIEEPVVCPKCKEKGSIKLEGMANFFVA